MIELPPEVWLHVTRFISDARLTELAAVNSLFFNAAMDHKWRQVLIMTRNTMKAMHILERLSDPFVAKRVRYLILRLTHVKDPSIEPPSDENNRPLRQIQQTFRRVFTIKKDSVKQPRPRPTFSEVLNALIATTPYLTQVRELNIDCWDLPPSYDLQPLFTSIWGTFGLHLEGLFLGGNVDGYRDLIESKPSLPRLRELRVEFTNNLFKTGQDGERAILTGLVVPFVLGLAPQLQKLGVSSWALLDVSNFFTLLAQGEFPILEALNIRMAFDKSLRDPSGLKALLLRCSGVMENLELRLNPSGLAMKTSPEEPLSLWLGECVKEDKCFARLKTLDLYPTGMTSGLDALLACIQRTEQTLVELTVRDRYLLPVEMEIVVNAASKCEKLKCLRMNVWRLDIGLLDHLAERVPNITQLWISIGDTATNNNAAGGIVETFLQDLGGRSYTIWKLKDITIWQGGQKMDHDTMCALARSIPSVNSFFGDGHMNPDDETGDERTLPMQVRR